MTMIEARIPGTRCGWSYETREPADIVFWLEFLRSRGFTEIVKMSDDVRAVLTCQCTPGWFVESDR